MAKNSTTSWQRQRIHQLRVALGMDRETYEEMLVTGYEVKSSKNLTLQQGEQLIGSLTEQATRQGVWHEWSAPKQTFASTQAQKRLRFHTLWCAVRVAPLPAFVVEGGRTLQGEDLRAWLIELFDKIKEQPQRKAKTEIPESILRHVSETFINPLCNKWLGERDLKKANRNPEHCYFQRMSKDDVHYLTMRWGQYQRVIEEQSGDVDVPMTDIIQTNFTEN